MNITIIGASAGVGLKCVERALQRGHHVNTLSRSVESLPTHANLNAIKGSATSANDIKKAMQKTQAVLVTIGTGKSTKTTTLYSDAAKALIQAQRDTDSQVPFIILTGFGAGNSGQYQNFLMKLLFKLLLKDVYQNKTQMEMMIAGSKMRWEFVRPGMLTDKPLSEKYREEADYYAGMNIGSVSRSDVADFMVKQAENPTKLFKYVALSNK